jgi:hypothetical protein
MSPLGVTSAVVGLALWGCSSAGAPCEPQRYGVGSLADREPLRALDATGPCTGRVSPGGVSFRGTGEGTCHLTVESNSGRSASVDVVFVAAGCGFEISEIAAGSAHLIAGPALLVELPCACPGNRAPELCTACSRAADDPCVCATADTDPAGWDIYGCYGAGGGAAVWRRNSSICPGVDGLPPDAGR